MNTKIIQGVTLCLLGILFAVAQEAAAVGSVRGGAVPLPSDEISPAERAQINAQIDANIAALQAAGKLPANIVKSAAPKEATPILFEWPLQLVPGHPEGVARTVINYVDHDPGYPGQVQDYSCGTRTYDTSTGYNHQGTDITSFPFAQRKQNNDEAIVVAAAPGTIVMKADGLPDHDCTMAGQPWNAIYLLHADGSRTWYGHMKAHSLTTKGIGDTVDTGEFLGVMGSSGNSTGPHLHFEVYDPTGKLIDPFAGPCNDFNSQSWWADQRPYYEPAIDLLMTGSAPVEFSACPTPDVENRSLYFQPGQTLYLTTFITDQLQADAATLSLYLPDGSQFASTTISSSVGYYTEAFWEWQLQIPAAAPRGTWRAQVAFKGQTESVNFQVGQTEPPRGDSIEYYDSTLDHYFMTAFPAEISALDSGTPIAGWVRTGGSFPTYQAADPKLATMCRFFGTPGVGPNTHFYTSFDSECALLMQNPDWIFEADAFDIAMPDSNFVCPPSTLPVFRIYNNGLGGTANHRYTTSWPVVNTMQSLGWLLEGVVMCRPM
jgi:murein DD-endopeptidase MepM/ murein hydrolase activator NlpD